MNTRSSFWCFTSDPPSQNALNSYCFVLFACMCLLGCLYTFFLLPETKGKTLLEIAEEFKAITICGKSFLGEKIVETKLWGSPDTVATDCSVLFLVIAHKQLSLLMPMYCYSVTSVLFSVHPCSTAVVFFREDFFFCDFLQHPTLANTNFNT